MQIQVQLQYSLYNNLKYPKPKFEAIFIIVSSAWNNLLWLQMCLNI